MASEELKEIVRRLWYAEFWDGGNVAVADELFATDYVCNPGPMDREGIKQLLAMYKSAFPDFHHEIHEVLAEGETVVARWNFHGTHQGDLMGIPPTGKELNLPGVTIHHFKAGKIVETWLVCDNLEVMYQLGVIPRPQPVAA